MDDIHIIEKITITLRSKNDTLPGPGIVHKDLAFLIADQRSQIIYKRNLMAN
jgi:hypothetical protein